VAPSNQFFVNQAMFGSSRAQRNQGISNQAFGKTKGLARRSNIA
jgi:hypothetical protein